MVLIVKGKVTQANDGEFISQFQSMTKGQPFPVEVTWNRSYSPKSGDLCEHLKQELSRDRDLQYGDDNT